MGATGRNRREGREDGENGIVWEGFREGRRIVYQGHRCSSPRDIDLPKLPSKPCFPSVVASKLLLILLPFAPFCPTSSLPPSALRRELAFLLLRSRFPPSVLSSSHAPLYPTSPQAPVRHAYHVRPRPSRSTSARAPAHPAAVIHPIARPAGAPGPRRSALRHLPRTAHPGRLRPFATRAQTEPYPATPTRSRPRAPRPRPHLLRHRARRPTLAPPRPRRRGCQPLRPHPRALLPRQVSA